MITALAGINGVGKSTIAKLLANQMVAEIRHYPNYSDPHTGSIIKGFLAGDWGVCDDPYSYEPACHVLSEEMSAMLFQCAATVNRLVDKPYLDQFAGHGDRHIILDRSWACAVPYGALEGLDPEWLEATGRLTCEADLYILLDIEPEKAMARRKSRDGDADPRIYESKIETMSKARALYLDLWRRQPSSKWLTVSAEDPPEVVAATVLEIIKTL